MTDRDAVDTVALWDPLVRGCHATFALVFFSNYFLNEEGDDWHQWLGYGATVAVLVRFGWGFVARGAASWADAWPTRAALAAQVAALRRREPWHRLGHSPLGTLVMLAMLAMMAALGVTGFLMKEVDYFWGHEGMEHVHALIADGLLALVCMHLAAALLESVLLRENLPLSMVTGRRLTPPAGCAASRRSSRAPRCAASGGPRWAGRPRR
jgi:cytochrome b